MTEFDKDFCLNPTFLAKKESNVGCLLSFFCFFDADDDILFQQQQQIVSFKRSERRERDGFTKLSIFSLCNGRLNLFLIF